MKIFGLPPDPYNGVQGMGILALLVAMHIPLMFSRSKKQTKDLASHLTGIAGGIVAGHFLEKKLSGRQMQQNGPQKILAGAESADVRDQNVKP